MSVPSSHCEAKLHGFRRTADGVVVSFVLHPAEVPRALALDPLGTRYMLALAQIGDDEQPVTPVVSKQQTNPAAGEHQRQRYAAMSPAEQAVTRAAMLPKDERFQAWVSMKWNTGGSVNPVIESEAAHFIRMNSCDGKSRKLIAEVPEYMDRFLALETEFKIDVGELARPR